jgi:hypothetical protein
LDFFHLTESASSHDVPDTLSGVTWHDIVGDHLIFDDVALKLDTFAASHGGVIHHAQGLVEASFVIDADFGYDKRSMVSPNPPTPNSEFIHCSAF